MQRLPQADLGEGGDYFRIQQAAAAALVQSHVSGDPIEEGNLQHRVGASARRHADDRLDDAGKHGRGAAGKTPFVAAVATTEDGKPDQIILRRVIGFRKVAIGKLTSTALTGGANVITDALACFTAVATAGCTHTQIQTGSGAQAAKKPAFKWVNTVLGNIKSALVGTYRAVHSKHVPRYLAEFEYRFNRRYRLETMIPRLAYVALRTAPMPYSLLKLADVYA